MAYLVETIYKRLLLRPPEPRGLQHWTQALNEDFSRIDEFIQFILASKEFSDKSDRFFSKYGDPKKLVKLWDRSQNGEHTLLVQSMIDRAVKHKVLVDVGAYGRDGSNSYGLLTYFGWKGVLVEANPNLLDKISNEFKGSDFELINVAAASFNGETKLYLGVHDEISSIHPKSTAHWGPIRDTVTVEAKRLSSILCDAKVPKEFGVLSIDAEGEGFNLLEDMFAEGFRPTWIIIEVYEGLKIATIDELRLSEEFKQQYRIVGRTYANVILERDKLLEEEAPRADKGKTEFRSEVLGGLFQRLTARPKTTPLPPLSVEDEQGSLQRADEARNLQQWPVAAKRYGEYLRMNPDDFDIWVQRGHAEKEAGQLDVAEYCYSRAEELRSDNEDLWLQIGHLQKIRRLYTSAAAAYSKCVSINPENEEAFIELRALHSRGLIDPSWSERLSKAAFPRLPK